MNKIFKKIIKENIFWALLSILFSILFGLMTAYSSYYLSELLNNINNDFTKTLIITLIIYSISMVLYFLDGIFQAFYAKKMNITFKGILTEKITNSPLDIVNNKITGKYISWYTNDSQQLQKNAFEPFVDIFGQVALLIGAVVGFIALHYYIAIAAIVFFLISILIPNIFQAKIAKAQKGLTDADEKYTENLRDNFEGLNILYLSNKLDLFSKIITSNTENREEANKKFSIELIKSYTVITVISLISQIGIIVFTLYLANKGLTSFGAVLGAGSLSGSFFNSIPSIINKYISIKSTNEIFNKYDFENIIDGDKEIKIINEIEFNNVDFSYDENHNVIDNFNQKFEKNKKYAIIGESGSGKSTLLKLILAIIKPNNGEILVNNIDLNKLNKKSYFENISYIDQNVYLFNESIRDNITLSTQISDEKLNEIIKKVNLTKLIDGLDKGLDTIITSNGNQISGGEKQRIAIARALVKNTDFLIIDEATSQLNKENAIEIENRILSLENIGVILISHHFEESILSKFDEVIRL